jgi:hypothetical protein
MARSDWWDSSYSADGRYRYKPGYYSTSGNWWNWGWRRRHHHHHHRWDWDDDWYYWN